MGKKKKHKIKKLLRAQALAQEQQARTEAADEIQTSAVQPEAQKEVPKLTDEESVQVKKDIKKILLTVGFLVIIIIAIYLVNIKTDFILQLGEWISRTLNINV